MEHIKKTVFSGYYNTGHCQGIAVDPVHHYIYYSFTTALIKTDWEGNLIGSAYGLLGHLGCIDFCDTDGQVYGSLEYKNDAIGRGILAGLGKDGVEDAFYIAIFDVDRLNRPGMDAAADGIMKTVWLREVTEDYKAILPNGTAHRYGCSGIDGLTIGPAVGTPLDHQSADLYLYVAYGIYGDVNRSDNDHQVILCYDRASLCRYARPLCQNAMHRNGPDKPDHKYFVYTGNTVYGVQNLEYDAESGNFYLCVYPGKKAGFPNPPLFVVDGHLPPESKPLSGLSESGEVLTLTADTGLSGLPFPYGATGFYAYGDGQFAVSLDGHAPEGYYTNVQPYRFENGMFFPVS